MDGQTDVGVLFRVGPVFLSRVVAALFQKQHSNALSVFHLFAGQYLSGLQRRSTH